MCFFPLKVKSRWGFEFGEGEYRKRKRKVGFRWFDKESLVTLKTKEI